MPKSAPRKPSSGLAQLQSEVAQLLMRPLVAGERIAPGAAKAAAQWIRPNDRLSSVERLQIYNQQYWWRLLASFSEDFPGLQAVLGPRKFDRLAVAYLQACGSTSWNLRNLGKHLPDFLHKHPQLTAPFSGLAWEMATVEWARTEAFDGPELPPIDPQKLGGRPPAKIHLQLQPYLTLLQLDYPIDLLVRKLRGQASSHGPVSNAVSARGSSRRRRLHCPPGETPIHLAVHRVDFTVYYKRLDPEAFTLLRSLHSGHSLEDSCSLAFPSHHRANEAAEKIQAWFASWIRLNWLCQAGRK